MATPFQEQTNTVVYTEEETQALVDLRVSIDDVLKGRHNFDSNTCLVKWLRAWKLNVPQTEKMIRQNIEYFEVNGLDYIDKWQTPEVLEKYLPEGIFGVDREGHPIQYIRLGKLDSQGMAQCVSKTEYMRVIHKGHLVIEDKFVELSKKTNRTVDKMVLCVDLEGLSLNHFHSRPLSYLKHILATAEDNYAGSMVLIIIISNSALFHLIWEVICRIIDDETKRKVHIIRPSECEEKMRHFIAPDQLPQCYGGTVCRPDTFCSGTIGMGGIIPKRYYLKNILENERHSELTSVSIRPRAYAQIPIVVREPRSILCWIFKTDRYDINFAIYFQPGDETTQLECVLSLHRCDSHLVPAKGDIMCITPGTYILSWDNTYSWFHSKQVQYICNIVDANTIFS